MATAADWFARQLRESPEADVARQYLGSRGLELETVLPLGLGYAPTGKAFPDAMKSLGLRDEVLLEARRKVEESLGRARAAVDEATAREARRLLEQAIEATEVREKGNVKRETWLSLEELRRLKQEQPDAPRRPPGPARPPGGAGHPVATAASEISLRGLRLDEAEPMLVKALDDAVAADLPYLRVIHGKGTGAVRKLVHDVLSADARVQRFGFAPANQGGHGVTIVEFTA